MYIGLFKKRYTLRRFGEQTVADGYASAPSSEISVRLNVQPLSSDDLQALPEGDRAAKRVKSFGPERLTAADEQRGTPGDWLFYKRRWYECVSSLEWDHTLLSHFQSEFVMLPPPDQRDTPELEPEEVGGA